MKSIFKKNGVAYTETGSCYVPNILVSTIKNTISKNTVGFKQNLSYKTDLHFTQ